MWFSIDPPLAVGPFDDDNGSDQQEKILKEYEPYIRTLVWKQLPRNMIHPDVLDLDVDELVQNSRVKLWLALKKRQVTSIKAYIRSIVHSEIVDMMRRRHPTLPLPLDEDGELYQGNVIATPGEGMCDPAYEVEQEELVAEDILETVDGVLKLPPAQRRAMICSLKERIDDLLALTEAFEAREVDIEAVHLPEEAAEVQKTRASLSIARGKLRSSLSFALRYPSGKVGSEVNMRETKCKIPLANNYQPYPANVT